MFMIITVDDFEFKTVDEKKSLRIDTEDIDLGKSLSEYDLCVTGPGLSFLSDKICFPSLLPRIRVYARVSPNQKVYVSRLNKLIILSGIYT